MRVWPGQPAPLGATYDRSGTNVAVFAGDAERVELCLFDPGGAEHRVGLPEHAGGVFHGYFPEVGPGDRYGFRVRGPRGPGGRANPAKLLLDPYARRIDGTMRWDEAVFDNDLESAPFVPRSVVVDPSFDWQGDAPPQVPWHDTVLYETHVRGLTMTHPEVDPALRGTYLGAASPVVIDHLRSLGVTAVEFMPIHASVSERHLVESGLVNYWGYNSIGFFAPQSAYGGDDPVAEFREMVRRFHLAGIEVILDVVYNHTAEAGGDGPTLCLRGFDNAGYYRLDPDDPEYYVDYTGCGISLNMRHPHVLQLIMDSLRYWITEMHVDGFRFDLAAALARELHDVDRLSAFFDLIQQDPVISRAKLIAEPWDLGDGGYQVGNFPPLWSEWNGRYRDTVRDVWRSVPRGMAEFAARVSGSADLYEDDGRRPHASINFVIAHDGFTLADLVSYEQKHNEANGEDNRDGSDDNRSWNCGVEGPTDDPVIVALRRRQQRNFLTTLMVSQGVPMLCGGDEFGRTQHGMNNSYAQDSPLSWYDWASADGDLLGWVRALSEFRRRHGVLRRRRFLKGAPTGRSQLADVSWFGSDGLPLTDDDWHDERRRAIGWRLDGHAIAETDGFGEPILDQHLAIAINPLRDAVDFVVPGGDWRVAIETSSAFIDPDGGGELRTGDRLHLDPFSMVVLVEPRP